MDEMKILTAYIHDPNQYQIETYEKNGGYQAIKKGTSPEDLLQQVKASELRGRGGAGFLTGKKWDFIPKDPAITKYLVCNADESEPGTFKDRLLMENDPHQLIEGILLASRAIGAKRAFIYCRGEYFKSISRLNQAVKEAKEKGYLSHVDIVVHVGAGAYIAGEETAQLNSLEGYRATPRLKPPFPAIAGLYGKPTIINNVETLCNVVHIVNRGVEWYQQIGKPNNRGTKIFQVSGQVQNPGCFEFPLGISLREVIQAAGGMRSGRTFKACYPGGSSCALLTEEDLDVSMDFESLTARGSSLGTASLIVLDDSADMVKVALRLMEFYQNESCGKCTPCREGTRWVTQVLARIDAGKGVMQDFNVIEDVCKNMEIASFCPLAVGAAPPIVSALRKFRSEFEAAILRNPQAHETPSMRVAYPYV